MIPNPQKQIGKKLFIGFGCDKINPMKDYQEKKDIKKKVGFRTSKTFRRKFFRERFNMGINMSARPRALGGHR